MDSTPSAPIGGPAPENVPPPLPKSAPPPLARNIEALSPSQLPGPAVPNVSGARQLLVVLLNLCFALFLADAAISVADDLLIMVFKLQVLTAFRGMFLLASLLTAVPVYLSMGLTRAVPKQLFIPVTLFSPVCALLFLPLLIYFYGEAQLFSLGFSILQAVLGIGILRYLNGTSWFRWPAITGTRLNPRGFSWLNLWMFLAGNVFVLVPAVVIYLFSCASMAVNHYSDGFVSLRPNGMMMRVRQYTRSDGNTIDLFPMSHVAEADFYQKVVGSFPSNSVVLLEGVTDRQHLITNQISYKRMARTLGLVEQQKTFQPIGPERINADVDVSVFSTNTINFLNLVMRMYSKGLSLETVLPVIQYSPSQEFQQEIFDDILRKRNRHLLYEIRSQLGQSDHVVVPWGAAHMPEIARAIQGDKFQLTKTWEYQAIRFGRRPVQNTKSIAP